MAISEPELNDGPAAPLEPTPSFRFFPAAPPLWAVGAGLLVWAMPNVSMTELLAIPAKRPEGASVISYFAAGLTAIPSRSWIR